MLHYHPQISGAIILHLMELKHLCNLILIYTMHRKRKFLFTKTAISFLYMPAALLAITHINGLKTGAWLPQNKAIQLLNQHKAEIILYGLPILLLQNLHYIAIQ